MAVITTYATLLTAVSDYLARSDLTTFLPNFVQNWEERFYRDPKNYGPWMETAFSVTIGSGVAAVPADFLAFKVATIGGRRTKLLPVPLSQLYDRYPRSTETGYPIWIARNGSNFEFGPVPDATYSVTGVYYAKQTVLRTDSDGANWLTANAPDLLLYGALLEAETFLKNDARVPLWQSMYATALDTYQRYQKETNLSGGPMQVQLG